MNPSSTLNLVLFLPLFGALVLAFLPKEQHTWFKVGALGVAIANLILSLSLLGEFQASTNGNYQFVTQVSWIPQFGVQYKIGADGISLVLVLLTTLLSAIAILSSFDAVRDRVKEYYIVLLLLETGMLGVFVSLDLILFYVFWEAMLIPMYFLIGIWGGARRGYATIKFVLYTLVGSLFMLVAIVWLYVASAKGGQPGTFDVETLAGVGSPVAYTTSALTAQERLWLFLAFAAAFAIKVPMWPLHTWLPDAHVEAPTAGSVILAGVLLKMGTYGFLRFCIPIFPDVAVKVAPVVLVLAVIAIIYGALVAVVQPDIKRLVAYSSVSHLGFCMLGLFAFTKEGVAGSVLQMINHGLSTGALFLIVGMIYERRHTREIAAFGGLWKNLPIFATFFLITMLSSVGLPGLNGFWGEFLVLLGTWGPMNAPAGALKGSPWAAILAATGVILGAVYMLWMFQRVMQGPLDNPENRRLPDLKPREIITLLPLIVLMFWFGWAPNSLLNLFNIAVNNTVVQPVQAALAAPAGGSSFEPGSGLPPNFPGQPGSQTNPSFRTPPRPGRRPNVTPGARRPGAPQITLPGGPGAARPGAPRINVPAPRPGAPAQPGGNH